MKKAVPTGICGLLCVCFSQIALFASERTVGWLFAAFAAACLLFSALSVRAGSFAARLAWLLPPAVQGRNTVKPSVNAGLLTGRFLILRRIW